MKCHEAITPDFLVELNNASGRVAETYNCSERLDEHCDSTFVNVLGMLGTPTTHVIVTELTWTEPTALEFTPHRPGFSSLLSASPAASIEYGFGGNLSKAGQLGQVLFMLPGKVIHSQQTAGTARAITCSFEPVYAESILGPLTDLSAQQIAASLDMRSSLISAILLRLMHEALHPGPLQESVIESFGRALLVECAHWLSVEAVASNRSGRLTARHLNIIEEFLGDFSGASPSVAELAAACGFSERYFAKLFREQMKCTIGQYIKSVQLLKAKSLLLETDLPLKEIAYRIGFSTPANFSNAFRSMTGTSPGEFRKAV
ncbi:MAG: AraC family transcriptional regulator [Spongiibacteraceae bacterium]